MHFVQVIPPVGIRDVFFDNSLRGTSPLTKDTEAFHLLPTSRKLSCEFDLARESLHRCDI